MPQRPTLPALLLSLSLAAPAFAQTTPPCQVTGTIRGLGNQPVVFFYDRDGQPQHDTVRAVNDRFSYAARPSDDGLLNLQFDPHHYTPFWYEPGRVTLTGTLAEPGQVAVAGTPENDLLTQYHRNYKVFVDRATPTTRLDLYVDPS